MVHNRLQLEGKKFGRLKVLRFVGVTKYQKSKWECQCKCGGIIDVDGGALISGNTKSCGCFKADGARKRMKVLRRIRKWKPKSLAPGEASFNDLYNRYMREAERRGFSFNLSKDEFRVLTKQHCHYCGIQPLQVISRERGHGGYVYNGIDRKLNDLGYSVENCVSCCGDCNTMKLDFDQDDFIKKVKLIAKRFS